MANAKGMSLIDMVKFLRARRDEALPLLPADLRHYLDEVINVARWYPERDMIGLVRVLVRLIPASTEPPLRLIGRLNARHHLAGAYRHLFDSAELALLPVRARTLWRAMHDTGDLRMVLGSCEASIEISGYGYPTAEMCEMIQPYLEELFLASGLSKIEIVKRQCRLAGEASCSYDVSWNPGAEST